VGLKTFQYLADELNAKGGAAGKKFEILPFDTRPTPQESLVQVQKAVDAGARIITQGNGSSLPPHCPIGSPKYNDATPARK
jgi:branched-chain amino acid transport system substrate-binding protein